jgi:hypothetical protein
MKKLFLALSCSVILAFLSSPAWADTGEPLKKGTLFALEGDCDNKQQCTVKCPLYKVTEWSTYGGVLHIRYTPKDGGREVAEPWEGLRTDLSETIPPRALGPVLPARSARAPPRPDSFDPHSTPVPGTTSASRADHRSDPAIGPPPRSPTSSAAPPGPHPPASSPPPARSAPETAVPVRARRRWGQVSQ